VQILGALESAGSDFDSLWFLNATDMQWPASAATHPFIPWTVQRDLSMPGTDVARTLDDCRAITQRIAGSAPQVTFSFARRGSEGEQRPSTCLREFDAAQWQQSEPESAPPVPAISLTDATDDSALPALPQTTIHGGAAILKLQALCPFRAFAERRLNSAALDDIEAGFDSAERGNLIHEVMAGFWNAVRTQRALRSMTPEQQTEALTASIDRVLRAQPASTPWQRRYISVQREWLLQLLPAWLQQELKRSAFQVIATEVRLDDLQIGPMRVSVRADRIDAMLTDEAEIAPDKFTTAPNQIILDYKTGDIPAKPWEGERPAEPQLPLYAVLAEDRPVTGIGLVKLKAGKMDLMECSSSSFTAQLPAWERVLTALAHDFAAGHAAVNPKDKNTCQYCAQTAFCRIHETGRFAGDEEADDV